MVLTLTSMVPGCGCVHGTYTGVLGYQQCQVVGSRVRGTYIGVHGYQQCQVAGVFVVLTLASIVTNSGVFMLLTLASMVTNSAWLWVFPWYLHWRPW